MTDDNLIPAALLYSRYRCYPTVTYMFTFTSQYVLLIPVAISWYIKAEEYELLSVGASRNRLLFIDEQVCKNTLC